MDLDFEPIDTINGKTLYQFADGCLALNDPAGGYAGTEISFSEAAALMWYKTTRNVSSDVAARVLDMGMVAGPTQAMFELGLRNSAFQRRAYEQADAIIGAVKTTAAIRDWIATGRTNAATDLLIGTSFGLPGLTAAGTGRAWRHPARLSAVFPGNCEDLKILYDAMRRFGLASPAALADISPAWRALTDHWDEMDSLLMDARESRDPPHLLKPVYDKIHGRLSDWRDLPDAAPALSA